VDIRGGTVLNYSLALWGALSAGTFLFIGLLAISAFFQSGVAGFKEFKVSYLTLILTLIFASVFFPIAWTMIHSMIKER
jgi:hypothetical protein